MTKSLLETEKRLGKLDFDFFNEFILGCRNLAPVHHELCLRAQYGAKRQLTLIPRGHLKSTILTVGYSVWRIVCDPNIRICIANAKQDNAETFLTEIKGHFESNQRLRMHYGDFVGKKWNEGEVVVKTRFITKKEPTVKTTGVGASLVSQHYDLVIGDDLINETNITTKDQIEKTKDWWRLAQSLGDGDQTDWRLVGTRYHYDDLYGMIIEDQADMYDIYIRRAFEDGIPIYPSKFNAEHLEEIKRNQGSYIFSCQYFNDPVDDIDATFRRDWLRFYKEDDFKVVGKYNTFITLDPAVSEEATADYSVFVVNAVDKNNNWWILEMRSGKWNPKDLIDNMFELDELYKPLQFGIEMQAFQKILRYVFEDECSKRNMYPPIVELKPDSRSKKSRIRGLQPKFEYGKIILKENVMETERLVDEYVRFPRTTHDDHLDALAYQLDIAYPPRQEVERKREQIVYIDPITKY